MLDASPGQHFPFHPRTQRAAAASNKLPKAILFSFFCDCKSLPFFFSFFFPDKQQLRKQQRSQLSRIKTRVQCAKVIAMHEGVNV